MKTPVHQITTTLTRYGEPDWLFLETLETLAAQDNIKMKVLVLDQKESIEVSKFCLENSSPDIELDYHVIPAKSLSFARNEAIRLCTTDILLYIDTDALAHKDWAAGMTNAMLTEKAAIAGGQIVPKWHRKTNFLHKSKVVLDQYSMLELGEETKIVAKVVGASFGLNIRLLGDLAQFDENLGRKDGKLLGGEETELCALATEAGLKIIYVGNAVVQHQVLPERLTFSWIAKRMYYGGYSRALRGGKPAPNNAVDGFSIYDYLALALLLPFYVIGYVKAKWLRYRVAPRSGIVFLYKRFHPIVLGADVHGYNLAKSLDSLGYEIFVAHTQNDGFTKSLKKPKNWLRALLYSKTAYLRISLKHPYTVNSIGLFFKLLGKKLVLEFNAPFEELGFDVQQQELMNRGKKHFKFLLRFTDGIVTVSDALKQHLLQEYGYSNVVVIPNGGEKFDEKTFNSYSPEPKLESFYLTFPKRIIWVANFEYIQGLSEAQRLSEQCSNNHIGLIIVDNSVNGELAKSFSGEHVYFLRNPSRDEIAYAVSHSMAGIAYYDMQKYEDLGLPFYNSPLKIYEYLANGLCVITNLSEQDIPHTYGRLIPSNSISDLEHLLSGNGANDTYRSWKEAALETELFLKSLSHKTGRLP
ncbi:glycosyltransferase [Aliiglaciecola litoralis]|uniref:Glycosyltransferase subfamily 4-like N-terminal domain-containing protein n=1 Tax=Aliiglaciecola litoralis TaxID=582857 RepID=A0ABP3WUR3_9ALTE